MTARDRPHWLDVVSDLLTHLSIADAQRSAAGTALASILSLAILEILGAQSEDALAEACAAMRRENEPDVAEALNLELQLRGLAAFGTAPAGVVSAAVAS